MPYFVRSCQQCEKQFTVHSYHVERGDGLFCSKQCKNQFYGRQQQGQPNAVCEFCGQPYHVKPRLLKTTRYCSRECKDSARTEEINRRISQGLVKFWENAPEEYYLKAAQVALNNRSKVSQTGSNGSRAEVYCHRRLQEILPYHVQWHDRDLVPGTEVDITIPEIQVAIEWMGISHREPIFGLNVFIRRKATDQRKREAILSLGWKYIEIQDTTEEFDADFVEQQVQYILAKIGF